jgi:hypothetical protein
MSRISWLLLVLVVAGIELAGATGTASATLDSYFLDIANIDPAASENHTHTFTFNGSLNVSIPNDFNITSYSGAPNVTNDSIEWYSASTASVWFVTQLVGNCTEGQMWDESILLDGTLVDKFRMLCIGDDKIVSLKFENGHGDSAWLDEPYFTYPFTVYTLIRVFEHSNYFSNEVGKNAQIICSVPKDLFVSGKFSSACDNNYCNITKSWEELDTTLFRVLVFAQQTNYSIGSVYSVNCSSVAFNFTHEGIKASLGNHYLESRTTLPLEFSVDRIGSYTLRVGVKNIEKYTVHDLFLTFNLSEITSTQELKRLAAGEKQVFEFTDYNDGMLHIGADFLPSWEAESLSPIHYQQAFSYVNIIPKEHGGSSIMSGRAGIFCEPSSVTMTTDEDYFRIKCTNYDSADYYFRINLTGDLQNITNIVWENNRYAFSVGAMKIKTLNVNFVYPIAISLSEEPFKNLTYTGNLILYLIDGRNFTQTISFRINPGLGAVNESVFQRFAQSVQAAELTSAVVAFGDGLSGSLVNFPKGGYLPRWLMLLIIIMSVLTVVYFKRKQKKGGKLLYIFLGIIIFILTMALAFG